MSNMTRQMRGLSRLVAATTLAAGSLWGATQSAHATPSTLGFYPSVDIYGRNNVHYDADSYSRNLTNNFNVTSGLTFGLGPEKDGLFGRTEAGFDYSFNNSPSGRVVGTEVEISSNNISFKNRIGFNAKTQLYNNDAKGTRLVAGTWGLGTRDGGFPNYVYLLGAKTFGNFGRVHVGVAQATRGSIVGRDKTSLQLGYDRYITPQLQFVADFYSGKGALSGVQPTLYYFPNDRFDFGLGYFRANDRNSAVPNQIYLCLDYNFEFHNTAAAGAATPVPETTPGTPGAPDVH